MHHIEAVDGVANFTGSPRSISGTPLSYAPFGPMKFEITYQDTGRVETWRLRRFLGGDRFGFTFSMEKLAGGQDDGLSSYQQLAIKFVYGTDPETDFLRMICILSEGLTTLEVIDCWNRKM